MSSKLLCTKIGADSSAEAIGVPVYPNEPGELRPRSFAGIIKNKMTTQDNRVGRESQEM